VPPDDLILQNLAEFVVACGFLRVLNGSLRSRSSLGLSSLGFSSLPLDTSQFGLVGAELRLLKHVR
jgi:hypothetical protein